MYSCTHGDDVTDRVMVMMIPPEMYFLTMETNLYLYNVFVALCLLSHLKLYPLYFVSCISILQQITGPQNTLNRK